MNNNLTHVSNQYELEQQHPQSAEAKLESAEAKLVADIQFFQLGTPSAKNMP